MNNLALEIPQNRPEDEARERSKRAESRVSNSCQDEEVEKEKKGQMLLTKEQFLAALPRGAKVNVNDGIMAHINSLVSDEQEREIYRDNLLCYASVLKEGRYSVEMYAKAVKYVSCKLRGDTNIVAYSKTYPDRLQDMIDKGYLEKDINSVVSAYHRTQLVSKILELSIVPSWILNQDMYQSALNSQFQLMTSARSEKVRCDAANSLLTHLKLPETAKVELEISNKPDDSIEELRKVTLDLVKKQREMLEAGAMSTHEVARQRITAEIIDGEVLD